MGLVMSDELVKLSVKAMEVIQAQIDSEVGYEWIDINNLSDYLESHEFADFAYISEAGYSDTAFGIAQVPGDAQAFLILPFNNYEDISDE